MAIKNLEHGSGCSSCFNDTVAEARKESKLLAINEDRSLALIYVTSDELFVIELSENCICSSN